MKPSRVKLDEKEFEALPWLHVYAQYAWHDKATIEGTRDALTGLRNAIDRALKSGQDAEAPAITAPDGEGYAVTVKIRSYKFLSKARLPYTADYARSNAGAPGPVQDETARKGTG